ncbi:unnamed protein product [Rhizoctonia solani]|uniref:Protein kinase domain-containing protein n=1 Tax=Rhizoctonia solani TaxID=456999 RepID=A0A8H3CB61_9AGAM|nr:unnamed protein product [Rhizoctonia solani]
MEPRWRPTIPVVADAARPQTDEIDQSGTSPHSFQSSPYKIQNIDQPPIRPAPKRSPSLVRPSSPFPASISPTVTTRPSSPFPRSPFSETWKSSYAHNADSRPTSSSSASQQARILKGPGPPVSTASRRVYELDRKRRQSAPSQPASGLRRTGHLQSEKPIVSRNDDPHHNDARSEARNLALAVEDNDPDRALNEPLRSETDNNNRPERKRSYEIEHTRIPETSQAHSFSVDESLQKIQYSGLGDAPVNSGRKKKGLSKVGGDTSSPDPHQVHIADLETASSSANNLRGEWNKSSRNGVQKPEDSEAWIFSKEKGSKPEWLTHKVQDLRINVPVKSGQCSNNLPTHTLSATHVNHRPITAGPEGGKGQGENQGPKVKVDGGPQAIRAQFEPIPSTVQSPGRGAYSVSDESSAKDSLRPPPSRTQVPKITMSHTPVRINTPRSDLMSGSPVVATDEPFPEPGAALSELPEPEPQVQEAMAPSPCPNTHFVPSQSTLYPSGMPKGPRLNEVGAEGPKSTSLSAPNEPYSNTPIPSIDLPRGQKTSLASATFPPSSAYTTGTVSHGYIDPRQSCPSAEESPIRASTGESARGQVDAMRVPNGLATPVEILNHVGSKDRTGETKHHGQGERQGAEEAREQYRVEEQCTKGAYRCGAAEHRHRRQHVLFQQRREDEKHWQDARSSYELRWSALSGASVHSIGFQDIPWPLLHAPINPEEITPQSIGAFILPLAHSPIKACKEQLRIFMLRWEPSRFERRWMPLVREDEQHKVRESVREVHLNIVQIWTGFRGKEMDAASIFSYLVSRGCPGLSIDSATFDEHPISYGEFSDEYCGRIASGQQFALRISRKVLNTQENQRLLQGMEREILIWTRFKHPNVIPLLGFAEFRGRVGLVSPWTDQGSILDYINNTRDVDKCNLCNQICAGLSYLHRFGMVHGDLKAANVLVFTGDTLRPVLTGFGNSLYPKPQFHFTPAAQMAISSIQWMAPEILTGKGERSIEADVYALGMTILEVMTGEVPYHGEDHRSIISLVCQRKHPRRSQEHIPTNSQDGNKLWRLLAECWAYSPKERPSASLVMYSMNSITPRGLKQHRYPKAMHAWDSYEPHWTNSPVTSLPQLMGFRDVPWPLLHPPTGPESMTPHAIEAFVLSTSRSRGVSREERLHIEMSYWDPIKFEKNWINRIEENEWAMVKSAAKEVYTALCALMRGEGSSYNNSAHESTPQSYNLNNSTDVDSSTTRKKPDSSRSRRNKLTAGQPRDNVQKAEPNKEKPIIGKAMANLTTNLTLNTYGEHPVSYGGFSDIYRGNLVTGNDVAIKALRIGSDSFGDSKHLKRAARELYTWSNCKHPNVLQLLGLAVFRGRIGMVSPWMDNGSLPRYLKDNPEADPCSFCAQISDGLAHLHQIGITHGDIKGANVLVHNDGTCVLADFGNSLFMGGRVDFTATTQENNLTARWAAPELLGETGKRSQAADIYALGMTMLVSYDHTGL